MKNRIYASALILFLSVVLGISLISHFLYSTRVAFKETTVALNQSIDFEKLRMNTSQIMQGILLVARGEKLIGLQTLIEGQLQIKNALNLRNNSLYSAFDELENKVTDFLILADILVSTEEKIDKREFKLKINELFLVYQDISLQELKVSHKLLQTEMMRSEQESKNFKLLLIASLLFTLSLIALIAAIFSKGAQEVLRLASSNTDFQGRMQEMARFASLGKIAADISHEIKNPLAILLGKTEQMERWLLKKSLSDQDIGIDYLKKMCAMVTRIGLTISSVQRAARQESGQNQIFDLKTLILENVDLYKDNINLLNINIELDLPESPMQVTGKSVDLSQVILNLLNNSCDAIESLKIKWIKIQAMQVSGSYEIYFTDSGTGIPQEIQKRLFQDFFTTKPVGKGTGLGLAICRRIMVAHHGQLEIDNTKPNTCFILRIPNQIPNSKTEKL